MAAALVLSFQETLSALVLLLGQLLGKGAHALWSHIVLVEIKAQIYSYVGECVCVYI